MCAAGPEVDIKEHSIGQAHNTTLASHQGINIDLGLYNTTWVDGIPLRLYAVKNRVHLSQLVCMGMGLL